MKSYVYILLLKNRNIFKIGKANIVQDRVNSLEKTWGKADIENSYVIECNNQDVYDIEKILHKLLKRNKVQLMKSDGYTEFFNIDSLNRLLTEGFNAIKNFFNDTTLYPMEALLIIENYSKKRKNQLLHKNQVVAYFDWYELGFVNNVGRNSTVTLNIFFYLMFKIVETNFKKTELTITSREIDQFSGARRTRLLTKEKVDLDFVKSFFLNPLKIMNNEVSFAEIEVEGENLFHFKILNIEELKIFKELFSKENTRNLLRIKGLYSKKIYIYHLLINKTKRKVGSIEIKKFCKLLNADSYINDFSGFQRRVLQFGIKSIKEVTNEDIELKFVKKGVKYSKVIMSKRKD